MPTYVAFLRAINVGGHTVRMDQLRLLFEDLGFAKVETFIASGNVIFDARSQKPESLERKIEKQLEKALGYPVSTFIRSTAELGEIARYKPFADPELTAAGNVVHVGFVASEPATQIKNKILSLASTIDAFHFNGREIYWLYRRLAGQSRFYGPLLEKNLGMQTTLRNVTTVRKIAQKYCGDRKHGWNSPIPSAS